MRDIVEKQNRNRIRSRRKLSIKEPGEHELVPVARESIEKPFLVKTIDEKPSYSEETQSIENEVTEASTGEKYSLHSVGMFSKIVALSLLSGMLLRYMISD